MTKDWYRIAAAALLATAVTACGSEEKEKDKQANAFYAEKLHTDDQSDCNGKGNFYDNVAAKCMDDVKLATFACTREGLVGYLDQHGGADATSLQGLDDKITEGYEMHQCGQVTDEIVVVVLVDKGRSDDEATIAIQKALVAAKGEAETSLRFAEPDATFAVNTCTAEKLESLKAGDPAAATADVEITLTLEPTSTDAAAGLYSDDKCTVKATSATIAKDKDSATFYVKATKAANTYTISAQTAENDVIAPLVLTTN